jgi:hypothetical protein
MKVLNLLLLSQVFAFKSIWKNSNTLKIISGIKTFESNSETIVSPFSPTKDNYQPVDEGDDELPLTRENVELVLDEMRPYLQSDGYYIRFGEC